MDIPKPTTENLELAKVAIVLLAAVVGIFTAYFVYRLGLRAYFRQKEYENVRKRYLENGVELVSSQVDYALSVHRHNWMLLLRTMKLYRDIEKQLAIEDFYEQFIELDQSKFQIAPMHKLHVLMKDDVVFEAYQLVFSFVGTTNDKIKADFASVLKELRETPNHPNKDKFIEEAEQLAMEMDDKSKRFYVFLATLQEAAEYLEQENLTRKSVSKFGDRGSTKKIVNSLRKHFPSENAQQCAPGDSQSLAPERER